MISSAAKLSSHVSISLAPLQSYYYTTHAFIADAKSKLAKCAKEVKTRENKLKELELEVSGELAKELEVLREQLPKCEAGIVAAQEQLAGAQSRSASCKVTITS